MKTPDIYDTDAIYASGDIDGVYSIDGAYDIHGIEKVYRVVHRKTGKTMYVGQTHRTMHARFTRHMADGRKSNDEFCIGFHLVREGLDAFDISIIEYCKSLSDAKSVETRWALKLGCIYPNGCNRILHRMPLLEITKVKISAARMGMEFTEAHRANLSAAHMGIQFTEAHRANLSAAQTRRRHTASGNLR